MSLRKVLIAAALVAGLAGAGGIATVASAADMVNVVMVHDSSIGKVLVDRKGMTLYVFNKDPAGKSVCNGKCAENWPPLTATPQAEASGDFSIITRDDGRKQWAYKGKPLYLWTKDKKPGDVTGDKVLNVWAAARP